MYTCIGTRDYFFPIAMTRHFVQLYQELAYLLKNNKHGFTACLVSFQKITSSCLNYIISFIYLLTLTDIFTVEIIKYK